MFQTYLVILVFAFAIPHAIMAGEQMEGTLVYRNHHSASKSRTSRAAVLYSVDCPPGAMGPVCSSDCATLLTCVSGNLISSSKCADLSANYPYCVPNTYGCTGEPDLSYETCRPRTEPAVEFTCTSQGYFPSPHNCQEYFFCAENSFYKYTCPPDYQYDAVLHGCQRKNPPYTVCHTINCAPEPNRYLAFPGNHAFYAFCSYIDGISEIIMFVCDHADTYVFNQDKSICEFNCLTEGWFPHSSNSNYYYECYYNLGVLVGRIQSCPTDYVFSPTESICIREV